MTVAGGFVLVGGKSHRKNRQEGARSHTIKSVTLSQEKFSWHTSPRLSETNISSEFTYTLKGYIHAVTSSSHIIIEFIFFA
jgi:hypothetical protein